MNGTRDPKDDFLTIYKDIRRPGADKLLAWLASTDFFHGPGGSQTPRRPCWRFGGS